MFIHLYSLRQRVSIDVTALTDDESSKLWDEIARKSDVSNGWTNGFIRLLNTEKTKANFSEIAKRYDSRIPQIKRLKYFLHEDKRVDYGAFFYVFNSRHTLLHEKMAALEVLKCDNKNWIKWVTAHNQTFDTWARISFEFDVYAYGIDGMKITIGEKNSSKKVCRFCQEADKTYSSRAHAIPEAIGNKLLFCAEECDGCNSELKKVEESFIHLMDFRRSMYRIASKNSTDSHTIKGKNYTIVPDENGFPELFIKQSSKPVKQLRNGRLVYRFDHYVPVIDQDIYRALAKMVIDLVPSDRLSHFSKTIDWIKKKNQDIIPDALPSVLFGILPEGNMFEQPVLYLFFRREGETDMPYCTAILFTTDIAYQFVVPYVDIDNGRFKYDEELETSRQRICKYLNIQWEFQQYYSWWGSFIWNYWEVDMNESNIHIRPDSDPIFIKEKIYTSNDHQEFDKRLFLPDDIHNIQVKSLNADSIVATLKKAKVVKPSFIPDKLKLHFRFDLSANKCQMFFDIPFKIVDNDSVCHIELDAEIPKLNIISSYDKYLTGATFHTLTDSVWNKSVRPMNRILALKARRPSLNIFSKNLPYELLRLSTIEFITPQGKLIKTTFRSIIE